MNTRKLRGIRAMRDVVRELNKKKVKVSLQGGKNQDGFTDKIVFSLVQDNSQDILVLGTQSKMELRISGDNIVTVRRLGQGGFKVKLNDKNFKFIFFAPVPQDPDDV